MEAEDLYCLYRHLRIELEAAYAQMPLDTDRIKQIVDDMKPLEAEFAMQGTLTLDRFVAPKRGDGAQGASTG